MRDRLIELTKASLIRHIDKSCKLAENIADYLLENGVITPKVKVGDKLYVLSVARTRVNEYYVTHLEVYDCGVKIFARQIYCKEEHWLCWDQDLGNDGWVFLTKEQAEKALAEVTNGTK